MHQAWILLIFLCVTLPTSLHAATVSIVKGKSVVILLNDESVEPGQKVELFDDKGKKRGILQISKTNKDGTKAVGKLIVGKAQKGWTTDAGNDETVASSSGSGSSKNKKLKFGMLVGFSLDSMTVTISDGTTSEDVDLSGEGYSIKGVFDFALSEKFQMRGRGGAEFFSASGDSEAANCTGSANCDVEITYFTIEGMAQYYLSKGKYSFWLGGGGAIAFPSSSSSNAIDADSLDTTSAIQVGMGFDIKTKSGQVPVEVLYSLLPKSDSVSATYITIAIGYMW